MTALHTSFSSAPASTSLPATARVLFSLLERMEYGALTLTTPSGVTHRFGPGGACRGHHGEADLVLRDWALCREVMTGGDVAFAEAYMEGRWDTSDLITLLTVMACNQRPLEIAFYGRWWRQLVFRVRHVLRTNSRRQAKKNIVAHYDLGNDFYRLWLDSTMTYSAALFGDDRSVTTEVAQQAKYARILQEIAPPPSGRLLELGCGWGGFAEVAARAGHHVTGVSLSEAQTVYARDRLATPGLSDRVDFRIEDYRDVTGTFDGIASIEMFEAVGERYWHSYFTALRRALKPGARACIQTITIADDRFEQYRTTSDFIQQHIFPGGMLASPSRIAHEVTAAGLRICTTLRFGHDYGETLSRWLAEFDARLDAVRSQGFDRRFIRCWRFYLAYCAAGFASETTDVAQYTLVAA